VPEAWPWFPNALSETLDFSTDIRMARSAEIRDSLKDATQRLSMASILTHNRAEAVAAAVRATPLGQWYVPEWALMTTAVGAVSGDTLSVDIPAVFTVGGLAFVALDNETWEMVAVDAVGATTITLSAALSQTYTGTKPKPVVIAPVTTCILPAGVSFSTVYPITTVSAEFLSVEPKDLAESSYPTHLSLPVVTDGNVPMQALAGSMHQAQQLVDSGFGAYATEEIETFIRRRGTLSFIDKTLGERWTRRKFLHYARGRDAEFWAPTGKADLPLLLPASGAALTITVKGVAPAASMVGRSIQIKQGANIAHRQITSASEGGSGQELGIAATGFAMEPDAVISLMNRVRFDVDMFSLPYVPAAGGTLVSSFAAPVVEVP
jgi:hypothetical protein